MGKELITSLIFGILLMSTISVAAQATGRNLELDEGQTEQVHAEFGTEEQVSWREAINWRSFFGRFGIANQKLSIPEKPIGPIIEETVAAVRPPEPGAHLIIDPTTPPVQREKNILTKTTDWIDRNLFGWFLEGGFLGGIKVKLGEVKEKEISSQ